MKKLNLAVIACLCSFVFFACKDDKLPGMGTLKNIEFDQTSLQISNEGGIAEITSKESGWDISHYWEIADGDTVEYINGLKVIDEINYSKDTVLGNWYSLYKKENILKIEVTPNISKEERSLKILLNSPYLMDEFITITQK